MGLCISRHQKACTCSVVSHSPLTSAYTGFLRRMQWSMLLPVTHSECVNLTHSELRQRQLCIYMLSRVMSCHGMSCPVTYACTKGQTVQWMAAVIAILVMKTAQLAGPSAFACTPGSVTSTSSLEAVDIDRPAMLHLHLAAIKVVVNPLNTIVITSHVSLALSKL